MKIGSPDDFIGAVSEPVQLRGRAGSKFLTRSGSTLGSLIRRQTSTEASPSPSSPSSPTSPEPPSDDNPDSPVNNFHKFVKETFRENTLIEEHQVMHSIQCKV